MHQVVGVVALLRRFPLRSALGESPARAMLLPGGLEHDREWELVDARGEVLTARTAPALAGVDAARADDHLAERLAGPGARIVPARAPHRAGAAVHLVAVAEGCEQGEPGERANLVLALDAGTGLAPGDESRWVGRGLRLGSAVVVVTGTPKGCRGVYADVEVPGEVAVGDPVVLLDGGPDGR